MSQSIFIKRRYGWILLVMLAVVVLRLHDISDIPPGLTHDEADHGITALGILEGTHGIYFTVGYGREPLYDYSTALLMSFTGPTYLAGRLVAVYYGLLLIAACYAWTRIAFDEPTALLTTVGTAVGFWAVMTSRQSLRSSALPAIVMLAVFFFWKGLGMPSRRALTIRYPYLLLSGLLMGMAIYTYFPARILWVIFPCTAAFLALVYPAARRRLWQGVALMLSTAALLSLPLFYYLVTHSGAEERIRQLSAPLTDLINGNATPLFQNVLASLGLFTVTGDSFWRYNIPGKPFLQPFMGLLFYGGVAVAIWQVMKFRARPASSAAYLTSLIWLAVGLLPSLITGPRLSMTQAIGMQPVIYLFPAIGAVALIAALRRWPGRAARLRAPGRLVLWAVAILYTATAAFTFRDYFVVWANAPEVRVQYETTLVTAIRYLNEGSISGDVAVSTTTPHRYHSPAVAQMTLRNESTELSWFDGRGSLLLPPAQQSHLIFPGFASLAPQLANYTSAFEGIQSLPMRDSDLDRPVTIYRLDRARVTEEWRGRFGAGPVDLALPVNFADTLEFLGYDLQTPTAGRGGEVRLATLWQVLRATEGLVLFTHVLGQDGTPVAQADRLDVPSDGWQAGAWFIQLHRISLPANISEGSYPIVIGVCQGTSSDCKRLEIEESVLAGDLLPLTDLVVVP